MPPRHAAFPTRCTRLSTQAPAQTRPAGSDTRPPSLLKRSSLRKPRYRLLRHIIPLRSDVLGSNRTCIGYKHVPPGAPHTHKKSFAVINRKTFSTYIYYFSAPLRSFISSSGSWSTSIDKNLLAPVPCFLYESKSDCLACFER